MTNEPDRAALEARAEQIRYLGTHFAMSGVQAPSELEAEYARLQATLRRLRREEAAIPEPVAPPLARPIDAPRRSRTRG